MPRYDFRCKKCQLVYEETTPFDKSGKYPQIKCPNCKSKSKEKLITTCGYTFANPEGTDRWNSESSGHDFRFHHNLPNVLAQRKAAELAGGNANPYNQINDLENNDAWGEVK